MQKPIPLAFIFTLFLAFGLHNTAAQADTDFSGIWTGSWTSDFGGSGGLGATIVQTGSSLSGTLSIFDTSCHSSPDFPNIPMTGTVSGSVASFSFVQPVFCADDGGSYNDMAFTNGTRSGSVVNGRYTIFSNGDFFDSGTFGLNKLCCTITVTVGTGGTVSPSGSVSVNPGSNKTFTISPNPGFEVTDVKVDGISKGAIKSYTFVDVDANHTLSATFARLKVKGLPFVAPLLEE